MGTSKIKISKLFIWLGIFGAGLLPFTALAQEAEAEPDPAPHLKIENTLHPSATDLPDAISADTPDETATADESPDADQADSMLVEGSPVASSSNENLAGSNEKLASPNQKLSASLTLGVAVARLNTPSAQFGKLNGVTDDRVYPIVAANLWSLHGMRYWNFKAEDLGLDNQSALFNSGSFGHYKFHLGYSEMGSLISNNSQTPFNGAGGTTLTLPTGFTRSADTTGMADLAASIKPIELGTKRKEGDASFAYELDKNFGLTFSFRRYLKNGVKSLGTLFRDDDIGPQSMILPEPVNYHTDEFRTGLGWHGERGQVSLDYYYSRFNNNDASLTWDNPFTGNFPQPYPDQGRSSLPPDNQHQRLSLSGSFSLASTTRLSALIERGSMTQNEIFLPYTINSASTISEPLPRNSADARIDTTLFKFDLTTQPIGALSLHGGYRHYLRDNKTPRDMYLMVVNDGGNQVPMDSFSARHNQSFGYGQNQLTLDSSYHFGQGTTFKLGYELDQKDYHSRSVNSTKENNYSARLNKNWETVTAFVNVGYSRKRLDQYGQQQELEHGHTSEYSATVPPAENFDNLPGMRQFDIANRDRQRQGLGLTLIPRQDLTIGLNADRNQDQYKASQFGLQTQQANNYTVDATLSPDEFQSWSIYYTRQNMSWHQTSRAYDSFNKALEATNPANDWSATHKDGIDTVGINIMLSFLDDQFPVQLSYAYSDIKTDIRFTADPTSNINTYPTDMPTLRGKRHTIDLSGTYNFRENWSVRLGALVETYRSSDWATDGFAPGTTNIPDVLLLSGSAAPYRAYLFSTALNYLF